MFNDFQRLKKTLLDMQRFLAEQNKCLTNELENTTCGVLNQAIDTYATKEKSKRE